MKFRNPVQIMSELKEDKDFQDVAENFNNVKYGGPQYCALTGFDI